MRGVLKASGPDVKALPPMVRGRSRYCICVEEIGLSSSTGWRIWTGPSLILALRAIVLFLRSHQRSMAIGQSLLSH